jgi:hypothetical protein
VTLGNLNTIGANIIGIYCTSQQELQRQRARDRNFLGHMGVIFLPNPNNPSIIARSQATEHHPYEVLPFNHNLLSMIRNGVFNVYVHSYSPS